jgi:hypothetical protein
VVVMEREVIGRVAISALTAGMALGLVAGHGTLVQWALAVLIVAVFLRVLWRATR